MNKIVKRLITGITVLNAAMLITGCKQFTDDLSSFLEYWTNEARIIADDAAKHAAGTDKDGFICLPSNNNFSIHFKILNPQNYDLMLPSSSGAAYDIITFPNANPKPQRPADYTFTKANDNELILTFKKAFLKNNEQGKNDLSPVIRLYGKTGRKFAGSYTCKLKCNSAPLAVENMQFFFDKQTGGNKEYILFFDLPDFSGIHDDVQYLVIEGIKYTINPTAYELMAVDSTMQAKISTPGANALPSDMNLVETGTSGGAVQAPTAAHPVYFRTGTQDGSPKKTYTVSVIDKGSLSTQRNLSTGAAKLAEPKAFSETGTNIPCGGAATPLITGGNTYTITLKADSYIDGSSAGNGVEIGYSITPAGGTVHTQTGTAPVRIELECPSAGKDYTITAKAKKNGELDSDTQTWTVKVKKVSVKIIPDPSSTDDPWTQLKKAVEASDGADIIKINGSIEALDTSEAIHVSRSVRIEGMEGADTNIINAKGDTTHNRQIFNVDPNGQEQFVIANICLTGGYNKNGNGGAVYVGGGTVTISNTTIQHCTAQSGGAVYVDRGTATLHNTTIADNTATGSLAFGGGIFIYTGSCVLKNTTIKNNTAAKGSGVFLHNGDLQLKGSACITGNDDLFFNNANTATTSPHITIAESLTATPSAATITPAAYTVDEQILTAGTGVNLTNEAGKFRVKDQDLGSGNTAIWAIDNTGKLKQKVINATIGNISDIADIINKTKAGCTVKLKLTNDVDLSSKDALLRVCKGIKKQGVSVELDLSQVTGLTTIWGKAPVSAPAADKPFNDLDNLTVLKLPNTVTLIEERAFWRCKGLKTMDIPDSVTEIKYEAFGACSGLETLNFSSASTLEKVGYGIFTYCKALNSFTLPASLKEIDGNPFFNTSSFDFSNLSMGTNTHFVKEDNILYSSDKKMLVAADARIASTGWSGYSIPSSVEEIKWGAFAYSTITTMSIPSTVKKLGGYSFQQCSKLESLEFKQGGSSIDTSESLIFATCKRLKSVTLSDRITTVGGRMFSSCSVLESITLPDSVVNIQNFAFASCRKLKSVTINSTTLTTMGAKAFDCGTAAEKCRLDFKSITDPGTSLPPNWNSDWRNPVTTEVIWKN